MDVAVDGGIEGSAGDEPHALTQIEGAVGVDAVHIRGGRFVVVAGKRVVAPRSRGLFHDDGADHAVGGVASDAAVVVVRPGYGEGVGAHADVHATRADGAEAEDFGVAEGLAREDAHVAVDVVKAGFIDPGDGLSHIDGERGRRVVIASREDGVVHPIAVLGGQLEAEETEQAGQQGGEVAHGTLGCSTSICTECQCFGLVLV